jgi:hypothetical protein
MRNMVAAGPRRPLSPEEIARVPQRPGAYLIYRSQRVVYIGCAAAGESLRAALDEHWRSDFGAVDGLVSFRFLCSENASALWRAVLRAYCREHGERLPELNETRFGARGAASRASPGAAR